MRAIMRLIEMVRRMMDKEEVRDEILDNVLRDTCDIDLQKYKASPAFAKYLIEISSANDENRKALAIACLFLKDKELYQEICYELLESVKWNLLHADAQKLLRVTLEVPRKIKT